MDKNIVSEKINAIKVLIQEIEAELAKPEVAAV